LAGGLCLDTARVLRSGGPWGQGFRSRCSTAIFSLLDVAVVGDKHLKCGCRVLSDAAPAVPAAAVAEPGASRWSHFFGYIGQCGGRPGAGAVRLRIRLRGHTYRSSERVQFELPATSENFTLDHRRCRRPQHP